MEGEMEKSTRESHALDAMTLAFQVLAETRMLSRFASTVEALDDYECASRAPRHIFLCSVSVDIQRTPLQVLWLVCVQLRRAGLGRYTVCRRFSKHANPIKAHPGQNGVHGSTRQSSHAIIWRGMCGGCV